jgi:hypothetical protein
MKDSAARSNLAKQSGTHHFADLEEYWLLQRVEEKAGEDNVLHMKWPFRNECLITCRNYSLLGGVTVTWVPNQLNSCYISFHKTKKLAQVHIHDISFKTFAAT